MRAKRSVPPPGAKGVTMRTGFSGHFCASALSVDVKARMAAASTAPDSARMRLGMEVGVLISFPDVSWDTGTNDNLTYIYESTASPTHTTPNSDAVHSAVSFMPRFVPRPPASQAPPQISKPRASPAENVIAENVSARTARSAKAALLATPTKWIAAAALSKAALVIALPDQLSMSRLSRKRRRIVTTPSAGSGRGRPRAGRLHAPPHAAHRC